MLVNVPAPWSNWDIRMFHTVSPSHNVVSVTVTSMWVVILLHTILSFYPIVSPEIWLLKLIFCQRWMFIHPEALENWWVPFFSSILSLFWGGLPLIDQQGFFR